MTIMSHGSTKISMLNTGTPCYIMVNKDSSIYRVVNKTCIQTNWVYKQTVSTNKLLIDIINHVAGTIKMFVQINPFHVHNIKGQYF